jgi:hypothetical protein
LKLAMAVLEKAKTYTNLLWQCRRRSWFRCWIKDREWNRVKRT